MVILTVRYRSHGKVTDPGGTVSHTHGVDSEVGRLGTVLLHRPGMELRRITPRNRAALSFDAIPWVARAQQEHDAFAAELRRLGVEVRYVTELLQDTLEYQPARTAAIGDFVIDPLPNLLFVKDSSVWIGDRVAVTSPATAARRREAMLFELIYAHHPRFGGTKRLYDPGLEPLDGGDVLLLAPGIVAVGTGNHTTPAGVERLARRVFDAGLAHTVLAVPLSGPLPGAGPARLDTLCTMVDADTVVMLPAAAYTLKAHAITVRAEGPGVLRVSRAQPFLEAAAQAMGIDRLRVIDTGVDPLTAGRGQWDDGNNVLAIAPRVVIAYERNADTNAALQAAGIDVITVPGSELACGRGGPRGMVCPVSRAPAAEATAITAPAQHSAVG